MEEPAEEKQTLPPHTSQGFVLLVLTAKVPNFSQPGWVVEPMATLHSRSSDPMEVHRWGRQAMIPSISQAQAPHGKWGLPGNDSFPLSLSFITRP